MEQNELQAVRYSNCKKCNRLLTNPQSIIRGYGRICFLKLFGYSALGLSDDDFELLEAGVKEVNEFKFYDLTESDIHTLTNLDPIIIKGFYENRQIFIDDNQLQPYNSFRVHLHSPDGFNWGYGGSGPAQLALAIILLYVKDKEWIYRLYQNFKWEVIAGLPQGKDFVVKIDMAKWFSKYFT